jgi:hypothetical protein
LKEGESYHLITLVNKLLEKYAAAMNGECDAASEEGLVTKAFK